MPLSENNRGIELKPFSETLLKKDILQVSREVAVEGFQAAVEDRWRTGPVSVGVRAVQGGGETAPRSVVFLVMRTVVSLDWDVCR